MRVAAVTLLLFLSTVVVLSEDQDDLLTRAIRSVDRCTEFMRKNYRELNVDGVLGVRMLTDQLHVLLNRVDGELRRCPALHPLLIQLDNLLRKTQFVTEIATKSVIRLQPDYYALIGGLLKNGVWSQDYPEEFLRPPLPPLVGANGSSFDEDYSDSCLAEVLGSTGESITPCNISNNCWKYLTAPGYKNYYITHEVLYLEIGDKLGCGQQMAARALETYGKSIRQLQNDYCSEIFEEAKTLEKDGFPPIWHDLLMEQIALCGILGYRDFFQIKWLEKILSLQETTGCYSRPEFKERVSSRRTKREDAPMKGGCSSHKTAVAMGALVVNIRFLVDDIIATQPCIPTL